MRIFYISAFLLLLLCDISGCALIDPFGEADRPHRQTIPATIAGSWILEKQEIKTYINGMLMSDSTYNTSGTDLSGYILFNSDGSYNSQTVIYNNVLGQVSIIARSNINGTYSYSSSAFKLSGPPAGLDLKATGVAAGDVPTIAVTAQSAKVDNFSANFLTFTTSITENYTLHDTTSVHLIVSSYYLGR